MAVDILVEKVFCTECRRFLGIRRGETYPAESGADPCCARTIAALKESRKPARGSGNWGEYQGLSQRSTFFSGSREDDIGPWGENAVRAMEDSQ